MDKHFRPLIVDASKHYLSDQYGITEERRIELAKKMDAIFKVSGPTIFTSCGIIDKIADICDTVTKFAFCVHCNAGWMAKKGLL